MKKFETIGLSSKVAVLLICITSILVNTANTSKSINLIIKDSVTQTLVRIQQEQLSKHKNFRKAGNKK